MEAKLSASTPIWVGLHPKVSQICTSFLAKSGPGFAPEAAISRIGALFTPVRRRIDFMGGEGRLPPVEEHPPNDAIRR